MAEEKNDVSLSSLTVEHALKLATNMLTVFHKTGHGQDVLYKHEQCEIIGCAKSLQQELAEVCEGGVCHKTPVSQISNALVDLLERCIDGLRRLLGVKELEPEVFEFYAGC